MAIAKKPNRTPTETDKPDPMAFIQGAAHKQDETVEPEPRPEKRRKEPFIIRFDHATIERIDKAAAKRGLSRAALIRMLVIENLPD